MRTDLINDTGLLELISQEYFYSQVPIQCLVQLHLILSKSLLLGRTESRKKDKMTENYYDRHAMYLK
jgi:hypothetical protein